MKSRFRFSNREVLILAAPYPAFWFCVGIGSPAVWRFWEMGRHLTPLDQMTLVPTTITFAILYPLMMFIVIGVGRPITGRTVSLCAFIALVLSSATAPLP